ncbi:penicillin-binding protein [Trichlorobacter ammonificans]|uniref:Cell division protein FtsI (Peptidoglycan synthetase) n=1 Tax=Trichlorobacter ammonificans TaxID=2916410 RepID=A0ABN8HHH0_9BACT|nr:penicillin-binding protein [Trichlorobacter ammonificans]CAH2032244.1 Cell division protein FtsI (Peptidoglycan synthetase) [Trichlorobacter ammonificans]
MTNEREKWARIRILMVAGLFSCAFVAVAVRTFSLQVLQHEHLVKMAERQHQRTVPLTPARGGIYDRSGASLAVSLEMDSLYAEPRRIKNPETVAAILAPLLDISEQELLRKLSSDRGFIWIERQISPETAARIRQMKLTGIGFAKESKRFYPNYEVAAHVLGFTGLDPEGLEGLERRYDSTILGKGGYLVTERDALGRDVAVKSAVVTDASPGKNLILTLDKNIQYLAEKELTKAVQSSGAKSGMVIVAEPATGKILAMANYPTFNPNSYNQYQPFQLRNRAVADSFEPGSTLKIFLLAAALEEKIVSPQNSINCENGRYSFGGRIIRDDHPKGRLTVAEVLKYSSNIGSAKIGLKLGDDRLHRYLTSFGFGQKTGIDLPGEVSGSLRPVNRWYGSDIATISFGQGISVSALQLVAATSAVANGGTLMKPYLVERITDTNGQTIQSFSPQALRRIVSPSTAASVTRMMEGVVAAGGTGTNAALEEIKVAGKTGTAQKADSHGKGYSSTRRTASFIGFVPSDKPLMTILVVIDEPRTSPYGGVVAAPVFREVAINSLCYLKAISGSSHGSAEVCAPVKKAAQVKGSEETAQPVIPRAAGITLVDTDTDRGPVSVLLMPDFTGMSMRRVLQVMEKHQLNIQVRGNGRVVEQHPQPGQKIQGSDGVWVRLAPAT